MSSAVGWCRITHTAVHAPYAALPSMRSVSSAVGWCCITHNHARAVHLSPMLHHTQSHTRRAHLPHATSHTITHAPCTSPPCCITHNHTRAVHISPMQHHTQSRTRRAHLPHATSPLCTTSPLYSSHNFEVRKSYLPIQWQLPHLQRLDDEVGLTGSDGPAEQHEAGGGALELDDTKGEGQYSADEKE